MIGGYVLAGTWSERKNVVLKNIMESKTIIRVAVSRVMIKKTPACEFHLFLQGGIGGAKLGGGPGVNKDEQGS